MPDIADLEELTVRLYLDVHVTWNLVADLRSRGYDVVSTQESGLLTASDDEQLEYAATNGRAIVTFNIRDFAPLHAAWLASGRTHRGIIVSQQLGNRQYGQLLQRLTRLLNCYSADDMRSNLVHLEQFR
jgi:predicted nuclease of predicted toxin-antitoxin system